MSTKPKYRPSEPFHRRVVACIIRETTNVGGHELRPGDLVVIGKNGPEPWRLQDFLEQHSPSGPGGRAMIEDAMKLSGERPYPIRQQGLSGAQGSSGQGKLGSG